MTFAEYMNTKVYTAREQFLWLMVGYIPAGIITIVMPIVLFRDRIGL